MGPGDSDPDIWLWQENLIQIAESTVQGTETLTRNFTAGDYVLEVFEFTNVATQGLPNTPTARGRTCFTISASAN